MIRLDNKGLTLVELLVSISIIMIMMSGVYVTYTSLFKGFKRESKIAQSLIDSTINIEIIRTDLINAGFGIATNETYYGTSNKVYPLAYNNATKVLDIYTTYNRRDHKTHGWVLLECEDDTTVHKCQILEDHRNVDNYTSLKVISAINHEVIDNVSFSTPTTNLMYAIGVPYDSSQTEKFVQVEYKLATDCDGDGNSDVPSRCHPDTKVLCRDTAPVVDCVFDWDVFFGYESSGSIVYTNDPSATNTLSMKRVVIYLFFHEGEKDSKFNFGATTYGYTRDFSIAGSTLGTFTLPTANSPEQYRWKMMSIDAKTVNIR